MSEKFYVAERLFDKTNQYFNPFYLRFDSYEIRSFFDNHEDERKYLTHFFFYIECLVCVRNTPEDLSSYDPNIAGTMAPLHANKLWYSNLITILIGIIGQTVSGMTDRVICECCGKPEIKTRKALKLVMDKLDESERQHLANFYKSGAFQDEGFNKVVEDIYSDRTFFAHDVANLNPPEKTGLTFDTKDEGIFIKFNIKPEEILLYIVMSLLRYWGYEKELEVCSTKKCKPLPDFM
jgi:hypothetical protein